ncbi:hypothetical protein M011DRAFT_405725 [Sporormia fimetaria CBS 119925]|uniref:tRNA(Phe) 7-[(3-amino-3-carboxypropyl)-4-demethylwyosine(37)-N(4)]-methyltransferase n=1 Tax=Sporormia fimetaria CBS 119925 TaxID=1340428 RepID=A0A6A6V7X1_9PLEO|nr:hypothetical protein M011DRAFT_405725 [Sporormia fimetaria CBS 119925]
MQNRFDNKKQKILELLGTPDELYQDLSPKGSVDEAIRPLIADINRISGLVTTSSCSGRVSIFCEGRQKDIEDETVPSTVSGGKGQGSWLYVSHLPITPQVLNDPNSDIFSVFGLQRGNGKGPVASFSFIHLKFEPMILHILTSSLEDAQRAITAALTSGFRESGSVSLSPGKAGDINPMVAVRSTGYSFDSIIGYQNESGDNIAMVDEECLRTLVGIANARFDINTDRISRFRTALLDQYDESRRNSQRASKPDWEDPEARRRRKREEGLARQRLMQAQSAVTEEALSDGTPEQRP